MRPGGVTYYGSGTELDIVVQYTTLGLVFNHITCKFYICSHF